MPSTSVRPGDRVVRVEIEQAAEMRVFGTRAAEIVPGGERDPPYLGVRFLRVSRADIGERDAVGGRSGPKVRVMAAPPLPERSGPSAREKAKTPRTTPTMTVRTRETIAGRWGCCT